MFLLGFWDDLKPLGAKKKLAGQVAIAALTWFDGIHIETFKNPFNGSIHQLGMAGCAITVLWLVALPNLINLIDGIDGLAGGIALMLMGLLCYFGVSASAGFPVLCAAGMVGSLVAFLRYNFPPARIYMGDGGAYFLGFLLAELSIASARKETLVAGLVAPLFVLALPIVDVSLAIVRRGLNGLPIFRPDRGHIHHKLLGIGYSPKRAVLTLYFVSLIFLVFGLFVFWSEGRSAPVLFGVVCLVFIVSAQSFQFSREWFSIGRVFGEFDGDAGEHSLRADLVPLAGNGVQVLRLGGEPLVGFPICRPEAQFCAREAEPGGRAKDLAKGGRAAVHRTAASFPAGVSPKSEHVAGV